jgi:endonuclease G
MSLVSDRINKAIARSGSRDFAALKEGMLDKQPGELASEQDLARRRQFLLQTAENKGAALATFERIIQGNELQDVNYLLRGSRVARSVGRISIREPNGRLFGYGTGFLIGERVLLTNNHVLLAASLAERSEVEFEYERDEAGNQLPGVKFSLRPDALFFTHEKLDFSVVAVSPQAVNAERALSEFSYLPLYPSTGKTVEGEWLTIIQHPRGELKQVCVRENRLLQKGPDVLWYSTDTLGGSSGAPAFNNDWLVVALHHSGVPETKDGKWQTVDGQDYDERIHREEDIKWVANEGIRVSRILDVLRQELSTHPLIQPILDRRPNELFTHPTPILDHPMNSSTPFPNLTAVAGRKFVVSFDAAGQPSIAPLSTAASVESALLAVEKTQPRVRAPAEAHGVDFRFDDNYSKRKGYDENFLGAAKYQVHLPILTPALELDAVRLIGTTTYVLPYTNMSLVMHQKRSFAIYSAANLDFGRRYASLKSKRVWRYDPRIPLSVQTGDEAYAGNAFDRGHLTRQEDMEYGDTMEDALQSTADTCHWTNVCTQHAKFNQTKDWWQGMERHILEYAVDPKSKGFRAQVFTGPVFSKKDPEYDEVKDLQIPMKFWKVCAAVTSSGKLFAVAYLLDQSPVIKKYGLKEVAGEIPFEPYKLFQLPISELEAMISMKFTYGPTKKALSECDPLEGSPLPILDSDQDGDDDRLESSIVKIPTPKGWVNLDRNGPYFG